MSISIKYIFRKRLPQYNSIEELFSNINSRVSQELKTSIEEVPYSGGSPKVLMKNIQSFNNSDHIISHITGDVHYMALTTGKNTVLTIHDIGSAFGGNILKQLYIKLFWFWLPALFVKRITVISEFTKTELSKIIPFAANKIQVIYNPVNNQLIFDPKNNKNPCFRILLIGTKKNKNLERTFEALKNIDCELLILGKLTEDQLLLLNQYNIKYLEKVNIPYTQVIECYKDCDLVLFASIYEGFGMPIIEAQAVGRAVITSNIGAMKEVAADSACLVNPFDVQSIKRGVLKCIEDDNYRKTIIQKGSENVKRFSLDTISNEYIKLYKSILN